MNNENTFRMAEARVNQEGLGRIMGARGWLDLGRAMHSLQRETLGELSMKPFRTIMHRNSPFGVIYAYTRASAEELQEAIQTFATPDQILAIPPEHIRTKDMPETWRVGRHIGFEVTVRPVSRKRYPTEPEENGKKGKTKTVEHDPYTIACRETPPGHPEPTREEVYTKWLEDQVERLGGATVIPGQTQLVSLLEAHSDRGKGNTAVGPEVTLRSIMTIRDPGKYQTMMEHGIGRQRAYGYGMLLLKPQRYQ